MASQSERRSSCRPEDFSRSQRAQTVEAVADFRYELGGARPITPDIFDVTLAVEPRRLILGLRSNPARRTAEGQRAGTRTANFGIRGIDRRRRGEYNQGLGALIFDGHKLVALQPRRLSAQPHGSRIFRVSSPIESSHLGLAIDDDFELVGEGLCQGVSSLLVRAEDHKLRLASEQRWHRADQCLHTIVEQPRPCQQFCNPAEQFAVADQGMLARKRADDATPELGFQRDPWRCGSTTRSTSKTCIG